MLDRSYILRQVREIESFQYSHDLIPAHWQAIESFVATADQMFGPITTVRKEGRVIKNIPWIAFRFSNRDWSRVLDAKNILEVRFYMLFTCCLRLTDVTRTQIKFSISFPQRNNLPCGVHCPLLKIFKRHGRQNVTTRDIFFIEMRFKTDLINSKNTTLALTRSRHTF
jgi:hypothetical protein